MPVASQHQSRGVYVHPECLVSMMLHESDPGIPEDVGVPVVCDKCRKHYLAARSQVDYWVGFLTGNGR